MHQAKKRILHCRVELDSGELKDFFRDLSRGTCQEGIVTGFAERDLSRGTCREGFLK